MQSGEFPDMPSELEAEEASSTSRDRTSSLMLNQLFKKLKGFSDECVSIARGCYVLGSKQLSNW